MAHRLLDEQVAASRMSRGDYIEYLLREKAGLIEETFRAYAAQQQAAAAAAAAPAAPVQAPVQPQVQVQTNFAPPVQPTVEATYPQPVITPVTDWNSGS
jgi:hypothetical protein